MITQNTVRHEISRCELVVGQTQTYRFSEMLTPVDSSARATLNRIAAGARRAVRSSAAELGNTLARYRICCISLPLRLYL